MLQIRINIEELPEGIGVGIGTKIKKKMTQAEFAVGRSVETQLRTIVTAAMMMADEEENGEQTSSMEELLARAAVDAGAPTAIRSLDN
jgi:hypothetical protein